MHYLHVLFDQLPISSKEIDHTLTITGISDNSLRTQPGDLFVAVPGFTSDGHDYINNAIDKGAKAIVGERDLSGLPVPYFKTTNARYVLAHLAARFYIREGQKQTIVGITGTNGKTTTSFMLKHILEHAGFSCALFGSVQTVINGIVTPSHTNTTLGALDLHQHLAKSNDDFAIMEVSSHALTQYRVAGIKFDLALFTNLSQDHLDYHQTMDHYFAAKKTLFTQLDENGTAILNAYDWWGHQLLTDHSNSWRGRTVSIGEAGSDLQIENITFGEPMSAVFREKEGTSLLKLPFYGDHNVFNAAMAYLSAKSLGIKGTFALNALHTFAGVPGRFEVIQNPAGAHIVIDYAHTEDAFYHCLHTAKRLGAKQVIHVFGFRGGRDESKRERMVEISKEWSDYIILTFDDLDGTPAEKMAQTLQSFSLGNQGKVILDRVEAIDYAWHMAEKDDWVFITGKGNEPYQQEYSSPAISDRDTLNSLLAEDTPH
ncbi:UDP-N-acetylmuramoyl-L-alanyl-D-glutamate--2,6-diaminopimelate ligase [Shouchella patagoniensis]|uniref:UDP-N-acetylmuramoyl-L-alanyl-D-glutamate--2, 6-diaminopimelate ligase n=1 Tax=Shouchella patagoniensis TaxID=228576 RepID=UPI00099513F9|nr:UDP-N-acetylmuramoyl-L-alanyl-D-glutamate--2,6-diaminopimelate ligase [Shouchella patagoniensis]